MVFVAVVIGVYLFFRFHVIDFFQGYGDGEQPGGGQAGTGTEGGTGETEKPKRLCEDCRGNFPDIFCTNKECDAINGELKRFNLKCTFTKIGVIGTRNTCVTSQLLWKTKEDFY